MGTATYREDLYYVQKQVPVRCKLIESYSLYRIRKCRVREQVVSSTMWWVYRLQFWRYKKMKCFNVLKDARLL